MGVNAFHRRAGALVKVYQQHWSIEIQVNLWCLKKVRSTRCKQSWKMGINRARTLIYHKHTIILEVLHHTSDTYLHHLKYKRQSQHYLILQSSQEVPLQLAYLFFFSNVFYLKCFQRCLPIILDTHLCQYSLSSFTRKSIQKIFIPNVKHKQNCINQCFHQCRAEAVCHYN